MRKYLRLLVGALIVFLPCAGIASGNAPTSAPVADTPASKEIRDTLVQWNTAGPGWTEADFRKLYYTSTLREARHTDYEARQDWEQCKAQKLVRDKWGPDAEAKFAHVYSTDTIEDDQAAQIAVDGEHAAISWQDKTIEKTALIKVAGHWLIDMHATFDRDLADDPEPEKDGAKMESLMQQAAADITAGKFAHAAGFLADFEKKYDLLVDDGDDDD